MNWKNRKKFHFFLKKQGNWFCWEKSESSRSYCHRHTRTNRSTSIFLSHTSSSTYNIRKIQKSSRFSRGLHRARSSQTCSLPHCPRVSFLWLILFVRKHRLRLLPTWCEKFNILFCCLWLMNVLFLLWTGMRVQCCIKQDCLWFCALIKLILLVTVNIYWTNKNKCFFLNEKNTDFAKEWMTDFMAFQVSFFEKY